MAKPPIVEVRGLGVSYRRYKRKELSLREWAAGLLRRPAPPPLLWALRDVSFECHEGEALGVIGHNGAGKSTLCLVLSGILTPDEGELTVRASVSPLLSLGAGLNNNLSGRENIRLYGAFLGIPPRKISHLTEEIIEFSELAEFIDEPMRYYSSGMRSRLSFSVATILDPQILILDEVLSAGDKDFRAKSRDRIKDMIDRSKLIVLVSHSAQTLASICTRCLWLENGNVREFGDADTVLEHYNQSTRTGVLRPLKGSAPGSAPPQGK